MRNPRRTAGTASALMVGVGVVTLFTVFAASLKASLDDTIDRSFGGDLVVVRGRVRRRRHQPRAGGRRRRPARGRHGRRASARGFASIDGDTKAMPVADPAAWTPCSTSTSPAGSLADLGDDELAVSDATAEANGWAARRRRCRSRSPTAPATT